jgi:hypothetical protein
MNELPKSCKECAEYGSHFCDDCLEEISKDLPEHEKISLSRALKQIARSLSDRSDNNT